MIHFEPLVTPRLTLRRPRPSDATALVALAGDFRIYDTTASIPYPYSAADADAFIAKADADFARAAALHLAVTEADADALIGYGMLRFEPNLDAAELGYWIGVPYWNRGFATETSRALIDYAFGALALTRLSACYLARNPESGRVLAKLGFVEEGVIRAGSFKHGYGEDLVLTGLLRSEWCLADAATKSRVARTPR